MVVEADESDGTFIRIPTSVGVVTNIDPEHLDYYGTEAALHEAFLAFFKGIPTSGLIVAGIDHPVVRGLIEKLDANGAPVASFGLAPRSEIRIGNIVTRGGSVSFDAHIAGRPDEQPIYKRGISLKVAGAHNALNAAAAAVVGHRLGLSIDTIFDALATFEGVDRRFTQTGEWNGVAIYDDYAHHPAEIEAALSAARGAAEGNVIAVMQPHRFSRLKSLFESFCRCFSQADTVLVAPVYPAGEVPNGFDRDKLIDGIREAGHSRVYPIEGEDTLARTVAAIARPGDLVIGLGAGTISEWARALPGRLSKYSPLAGAAE
jgi:UDP-N-acetylmuramate--alanine ligase